MDVSGSTWGCWVHFWFISGLSCCFLLSHIYMFPERVSLLERTLYSRTLVLWWRVQTAMMVLMSLLPVVSTTHNILKIHIYHYKLSGAHSAMWQKVILDFTGEKNYENTVMWGWSCVYQGKPFAHVFGWWVNDGYPASLVTMVMDWMPPPPHHWWCMQSKSGKMRQTLCIRNRSVGRKRLQM